MKYTRSKSVLVDSNLGKVQLLTDGVTVWVNAEALLGRFGVMGIDVHTPPEAQINEGMECLYCTHGQVTVEDWTTFVNKMKEHYGVAISDDFMPVRFRT